MKDVGILYYPMVYFNSIWFSLWAFGIFFPLWYIFPVLVRCIKKILATLYTIEGKKVRPSTRFN
jgi:hypothetical protein